SVRKLRGTCGLVQLAGSIPCSAEHEVLTAGLVEQSNLAGMPIWDDVAAVRAFSDVLDRNNRIVRRLLELDSGHLNEQILEGSVSGVPVRRAAGRETNGPSRYGSDHPAA